MQPTYLPWAGYFNLIASVDKFVFLDTVQFDRRSWQTRNRILLNENIHMLSVPVRKAPRSVLIKDVAVADDTQWRKKHLMLLEHAYRKAPFGDDILDLLSPIIGARLYDSLALLNITIIEAIASSLTLKNTEMIAASSLNSDGKRSEYLRNICEEIRCNSYLSPVGSAEYLAEDQFSQLSDIQLEIQDFSPTSYPQWKAKEFTSHLSIVDVVANLGFEETRKYCLGLVGG